MVRDEGYHETVIAKSDNYGSSERGREIGGPRIVDSPQQANQRSMIHSHGLLDKDMRFQKPHGLHIPASNGRKGARFQMNDSMITSGLDRFTFNVVLGIFRCQRFQL